MLGAGACEGEQGSTFPGRTVVGFDGELHGPQRSETALKARTRNW